MTLDEKIGQMVIAGIGGYENDSQSTQLIQNYHVGGFILFKENIKDTNQTLELINSLKDSNSKNKAPLFFSVDEEGGKVSRMPDEFVKIPSNERIGKTNDGDLSYEIGQAVGKEIKVFGFNMNFAPVLDINSNPNNPVIGDRSFGNNAELVSNLGIKTMKGLQSQKIISAVKHFPGHGDTSVDSHVGLPVVNNDLDRLKKFELIPFADAIKNNVDVIMIAHILFPKIDAQNPSTMSRTIITDILRNDMQFDGVVITDDMTMGAIEKNYGIAEAAIKSVNAGSDIILVCHGYDKQVNVINSLKQAVKQGKISESRIDESVCRILSLKQKYNLSDAKCAPFNVNDINNTLKNVVSKIK